MNLTWHIVKKDLRALKWPLLLWTLLIVGKLGVGLILLQTKSTDTEAINSLMHLDALAKILAGLECVSFVLAAALLQEDLLVGTTAFWVTRPISGARLLRAKLLGLLLIFGLLPLLVTLPWWLWNGYGLHEIGWAALETLLIHTACVLVGLLWAAVTDGFARFLLWTLVTLVSVPLAAGAVSYYVSNHLPLPLPGVSFTRGCVTLALVVAGILTVVVHQFLTRKTWRSVVMISATTGLIAATLLWWPWNWDQRERWNRFMMKNAAQHTRLVTEPAGLTFAVESVQMTPPTAAHPERPSKVLVRFTVKGLTAGLSLRPSTATYTLRWPDGKTGSGTTWLSSSYSPQKMAARALPGNSQQGEDEPERFYTTIMVEPDMAARFLREAPVFTMDSLFWLMRFDSVTPVPPQTDGRIRDGATAEWTAATEMEGNALMVTTVRTRPDYWLNVIHGHLEALRSITSESLLLNHARGEVEVSYRHREWGLQARIASVSIELGRSGYKAPIAGNKINPLPADLQRQTDWLRRAELTRVNYAHLGRFSHTLQVDALRLDGAKP